MRTQNLINEIIKLVLPQIQEKLPKTHKTQYENFLRKYLRSCLTEINHKNYKKLVFLDQQRHIYFYGPIKPELITKIVRKVTLVTCNKFAKTKKHHKKRKTNNKKR